MNIPAGILRSFCASVFERFGLPPADAAIVADALVLADLRGVDSHGVTRLRLYTDRLRRGLVNPAPAICLEGDPNAATARMDGDHGMGQVIGVRAMDEAMARARAHGVGVISVRRSTHFGMAAYFTLRPVAQDMIGMACCNASMSMVPWGGSRPYFGTNPISFAIPAGRHRPIVLDMATSVVARGKIVLARKLGKEIEPGLVVDADGRPTRDPAAALTGAVLPFGTYKGSGLALVIEALSAALSGAALSPYVGSAYTEFSRPQNVGAFFLAMALDHFGPPAAFKARMDQMIDGLKQIPAAPDVERMHLPGEPEFDCEAERRRSGIPIEPEILEELTAVARDVGVRLPPPMAAAGRE